MDNEMETLEAILASYPEITEGISWEEVRSRLAEHREFDGFDDASLLKIVGEHIWKCADQVRAEEQMQQERMERQKVAAEAAFAALLEKHKERGTLRQGMSWREFRGVIAQEPALEELENCVTALRPAQMFKGFLTMWPKGSKTPP